MGWCVYTMSMSSVDAMFSSRSSPWYSKILHIFKCLVEDTVDRSTTCQNRLVSFHSYTHNRREKVSFYNCYICALYLGLLKISSAKCTRNIQWKERSWLSLLGPVLDRKLILCAQHTHCNSIKVGSLL